MTKGYSLVIALVIAVLSETGKFLEYQAIFPHTGNSQRDRAKETIKNLIEKYKIELIAIGNGTASRETDEFMSEVLANLEQKPIKVMVKKLLKKKLDETGESCVNYVGVDLNTASRELLMFVSGITPTIANNIVAYRNENGAFKNRRSLLKVGKLGPKAFELAAGFLRIRGGDNPLDNTAVHPESYGVVKEIAAAMNVPLAEIDRVSDRLNFLYLNQFVTDTIGFPTLEDVVSELEKPGRDPRAEFKYATFKEGINEISDCWRGWN